MKKLFALSLCFCFSISTFASPIGLSDNYEKGKTEKIKWETSFVSEEVFETTFKPSAELVYLISQDENHTALLPVDKYSEDHRFNTYFEYPWCRINKDVLWLVKTNKA